MSIVIEDMTKKLTVDKQTDIISIAFFNSVRHKFKKKSALTEKKHTDYAHTITHSTRFC